jgi:hypothetical protein
VWLVMPRKNLDAKYMIFHINSPELALHGATVMATMKYEASLNFQRMSIVQ